VIISVNEELEALSKPIVTVLVVTLDGGVLDGAVHPFVHRWFGLVNRCSMPCSQQI